MLLSLYKTVGRKWKTISANLIGRSENAIKNRFTLLMTKYSSELVDGAVTVHTIDSIRHQILTNNANETLEKEFPCAGYKPSLPTLKEFPVFRPEATDCPDS